MRQKKVEGEYQPDSWPTGPGRRLCPLARPDIAMDLESQIEAWSARGLRRRKIFLSQDELASCLAINTTPLNSVESHRFLTGSGTTLLISDLGDSDVTANDTEVGEAALLTSPFIEESGRVGSAHCSPPPRSIRRRCAAPQDDSDGWAGDPIAP